MADFTKQTVLREGGGTGKEDTSSSSSTRREEPMQGRPDHFVLDMESISLLSHTTTNRNNNDNSEVGELGSTDIQVPLTLKLQKNLSRKGSPSVEGGGAGNNHHHLHISRAAGLQPPIHHKPGHDTQTVVDSPSNDGPAGTLEATSFRRRRAPSPPSSWLNPRRVLLMFATISSVGTLILLYFTLSMESMDGGDHNPE